MQEKPQRKSIPAFVQGKLKGDRANDGEPKLPVRRRVEELLENRRSSPLKENPALDFG